MKICSLLHGKNPVSVLLSLILLTVMGMFILNGVHVDARCIHDAFESPLHKPSPQLYDRRLMLKESTSTTETPLPTTAKFETQNTDSTHEPSEYIYYYDYTSYSSASTNSISDTKLESDIGKKRKRRSNKRKQSFKNPDFLDHVKKIKRKSRSITSEQGGEEHSFGENIAQESDALADLFKPLRISVWYDHEHLAYSNGSIEFERLHTGVVQAVDKIKKLFSVIPVHGSLLLSRDNDQLCGGVHWNASSPNYGRCGSINPRYNGERCLDNFQIPDDHLRGFNIYNSNDTTPIPHFRDGGGIPNTDTVIYIRSQNTLKCADGGIVAYATYCQTDQFNRPISGFLNFCPRSLTSETFDPDQFYLSVLHEMFHVLGFSQKLFNKFQNCKVEIRNSVAHYACEDRSNVFGYVREWYRILTPSVSWVAQNHFNCSYIKGPLEANSEMKRVSSHWESRYIQPSLMTSSIGLPHLTVLDRITLAVFQDTGWYKVNMSEADELFWGKNAGCEFGTTTSCRSGNSPFFCTTSEAVNGCHYLHLDKGICETNDFLDSCKVYQASKGSECWVDPYNENIEETEQKGELYNINSRCFISNLSKQGQDFSTSHSISRRSIPEEGRCYEHRCNNSRTLEIRVRGSSWFLCPSRRMVKIPDYDGSIRCPDVRLMCNPNIKTTATSSTQVCATINISFTNLNIFLNTPLPAGTSPQSRYLAFVKEFADVVNKMVKANGTEISGRITRTGTNQISFRLKPVEAKGKQKIYKNTCSEAVRRLKTMVTEKLLFVPVEGTEITAKAIAVKFALAVCNDEVQDDINNGDNNSNVGNSNHKPVNHPKAPQSGIIAAITVGAACSVVFASVGTILYLKSKVVSAVGPAMGSGVVAYQPRGSLTTGSESGSMGPIQFTV